MYKQKKYLYMMAFALPVICLLSLNSCKEDDAVQEVTEMDMSYFLGSYLPLKEGNTWYYVKEDNIKGQVSLGIEKAVLQGFNDYLMEISTGMQLVSTQVVSNNEDANIYLGDTVLKNQSEWSQEKNSVTTHYRVIASSTRIDQMDKAFIECAIVEGKRFSRIAGANEITRYYFCPGVGLICKEIFYDSVITLSGKTIAADSLTFRQSLIGFDLGEVRWRVSPQKSNKNFSVGSTQMFTQKKEPLTEPFTVSTGEAFMLETYINGFSSIDKKAWLSLNLKIIDKNDFEWYNKDVQHEIIDLAQVTITEKGLVSWPKVAIPKGTRQGDYTLIVTFTDHFTDQQCSKEISFTVRK